MSKELKQKCTSGKFKRLNYYHGMLLTEEDFQAEQEYFREKMKLHNRLHGYGVVWGLGLKVKCVEIAGEPIKKIFIEPGLAFDCAGNEIVVCHSHLVPLDEKIHVLWQECKAPDPNTKLLIAIRYCECASDPGTQYASQCSDDQLLPQMSRTREGYSVQVLEEGEVPECCKDTHAHGCLREQKQDCPGLASCCWEEHVIILGCVVGLEALETSYRRRQEAISAGYDTGETDKGRNFTEENLDPCCKPRRVCLPCNSPLFRWEYQKESLIHEACIAYGWVDFSGVVGKSVSEAQEYLASIELKPGTQRSVQDYDPQALMARVASAISCAPVESSIELILDKESKCVLFALPENPD